MSGNKAKSKPTGLPILHEFAAGVDVGSRFHVVAVSPDLSDEPVRTFQAFTADLHRMADWLIDTGIKTVAMESTGVYLDGVNQDGPDKMIVAPHVLGRGLRDPRIARARCHSRQCAHSARCSRKKK